MQIVKCIFFKILFQLPSLECLAKNVRSNSTDLQMEEILSLFGRHNEELAATLLLNVRNGFRSVGREKFGGGYFVSKDLKGEFYEKILLLKL